MQATWTPDGQVFFWSLQDPLEVAAEREFPELLRIAGRGHVRALAIPGESLRRRRVQGLDVALSDLLGVLIDAGRTRPVSDALRVLVGAAKLGVRLAAAKRVVPTVIDTEARWRALLVDEADRASLAALVAALPPWSRGLPLKPKGKVELASAERVVRSWVDGTVDALYRTDAWPASARGWARDLAEALRGDTATFQPREARHQAIPELLRVWSNAADTSGLMLGLRLGLPRGRGSVFPLSLHMVSSQDPSVRIPLSEAWTAGSELLLAGQAHEHPAHHALRGLARAARTWPPLGAALQGREPVDLKLDTDTAWDFLSKGAPALKESGFQVRIPPEFEAAGSRRLRARMRIEMPDGSLDRGVALDSLLKFRWEVTIGDTQVAGDTFHKLIAHKSPIVRHEGHWVLLDPAEVARLPSDLTGEGSLPAAAALRAVLTGQHEGIPVVADDRLDLIIEALRNPPESPVPDAFNGELRPYQTRGFSWLSTLGKLGLGACLADDMGLGKTVQVIAYLLSRPRGPHLVVCPTSVLGNWAREIQRFAPGLKVYRHHGLYRNPRRFPGHDVVLTTYGLLSRDAGELQAYDWDAIVLDEAQAIKNPDSKRAKAARELSGRHRLALSGTPVENRLDELWSLMEFLVPGLLGPRRAFQRNVAVPIERFGDEELAHQLKLGVSPFLLRRLKTDPKVITDLPEKIERRDYAALTAEQARLYKQVFEEAMESIAEAESIARRGRVLAMLTALKQVCNHPDHYLKEGGDLGGRSGKLERVEDLLSAAIEVGDRILIFTQYREMGTRLQRRIQEVFGFEAPFLHGGTPMEERDRMVDAFQTDDEAAPVLIISLRAGGTGLNLTRATHVIHYDRWWNPAVEDQATDRAYRIGQQRNVQVYKMVTQGTLEEKIDALLEEKRALAESVVGSGEAWVTELDDDALRALVSLGEDALVEDE